MHVRYGMIGGGEGAFIGELHRAAAALAGHLELVAGAFSSTVERSKRSGLAIGVAPERTYGSFTEMIEGERTLPACERMEAVVIAAPNHIHAPAAISALEAGFHVLCDKPAADTLENARRMADVESRSGRILAVAHNYIGYPMVRQARALIAEGGLGFVRRVIVRYTQGWLAQPERLAGNKQAAWRLDPALSGEGGALSDIGTHAFYLLEYVTGQRVSALCADITALEGRLIDDDGAMLARLEGGGRAVMIASQVCTGDANNLQLSVYCEKAGLHWAQENPGHLIVRRATGPEEVWHAGKDRDYLSMAAMSGLRTPAGHPEGYLEAFANLYRDFAADIRAGRASDDPGYGQMPEALAAMRFVRAARRSSERGSVWVELDVV